MAAGLVWRKEDVHHAVHGAFSQRAGGLVGVARFNRQWLVLDPGMLSWWYAVQNPEKLARLKGHRRYPTKEAAMAACTLIYA